jgi:2-hydroxychromene-2-carboxylate isomerase
MALNFAFDVVCPFAYLASHRVARLAAECGVNTVWRPVLLGGLYAATSAPQARHRRGCVFGLWVACGCTTVSHA